MTTTPVLDRIRQLTATLDAPDPEGREALHQFERVLARRLLADPQLSIHGNRPVPTAGAAPRGDAASPTRYAHLDAVRHRENEAAGSPAPLATSVFRRDTAFRTPLLGMATPGNAAGMAPNETWGPFIDEDGRPAWFDVFFGITLVSVFLQGAGTPALRVAMRGLPLSGRDFRIDAGSAWIASGLLARTSALDGYFTGLRIRGGTLSLSQDATVTGSRVVLAAGTVARLHLDLDQAAPHPAAPDDTGLAGRDALASDVRLPATLDMRFSSTASTFAAGAAACRLFGTGADFRHQGQPATWAPAIGQILAPFAVTLLGNDSGEFHVESTTSKLCTLAGHAPLNVDSGWLLPAARLPVDQLGVASGTGALCIGLDAGLTARWKGLRGGATRLLRPALIVDPDTLSVIDFFASNPAGRQRWTLWRNQANAHRSAIELDFGPLFPLIFVSSRVDSEALYFFCSHRAAVDRPLDANGKPLEIASAIAFGGITQHGGQFRVALQDDDLWFDGQADNPAATARLPLALRNAFFNVSRPYSLALSGELLDDTVVARGELALAFAIALYLPMLEDPYVASTTHFLRDPQALGFGRPQRALAAHVKWPAAGASDDAAFVYFRFIDPSPPQRPQAPPGGRDFRTGVQSFHRPLAPAALATMARDDLALSTADDAWTTQVLAAPAEARSASTLGAAARAPDALAFRAGLSAHPLLAPRADAAAAIDRVLAASTQVAAGRTAAATRGTDRTWFTTDSFLLLDVSSRADQLGVGLGPSVRVAHPRDGVAALTYSSAFFGAAASGQAESAGEALALQIDNMDVVAPAAWLRAVTLPQISWEPIWNIPLPIEGAPAPDDLVTVTPGPIVFENDGIPTRLYSESPYAVPISPARVARHFLQEFNDGDHPRTVHSTFTLPFALVAQADFERDLQLPRARQARLDFNAPRFPGLQGGLQVRAIAPAAPAGTKQGASFPGWTLQLDNIRWALLGIPLTGTALGRTVSRIFNQEFHDNPTRKVPVERMDLSGYGASIFSNWRDPGAEVAQVSQARFDVLVGRTAHEVVQVRSILYPFAVHVVRTITLMRSPNGYVFRSDSGWKAEGDGFFDFSYAVNFGAGPSQPVASPYAVHAQPVKGVSNVREIRDFPAGGSFDASFSLDDPDSPAEFQFISLAQWQTLFDIGSTADPLAAQLQAVVFDADVHLDNVVAGGTWDPVRKDWVVPSRKMLGYVQLAPAAVLLPAHVFAALLEFQNGSLGGPVDCTLDIAAAGQRMRLARVDVNPALDASGRSIFATAARGSLVLPADGAWAMALQRTDTGDVQPVAPGQLVPLIKSNTEADFRIAAPQDIVQSGRSRTRFGVLQSTGTQKLLFDAPRFTPGEAALKSGQTYFADAYKLLNSTGIFANVANALALTPSERSVEILGDGLMKLARRDIPLASLLPADYQYAFVDEPGVLRIYAEYKTRGGDGLDKPGTMTLGLDSAAAALEDRWKAATAGMRVVVDLGPFERLMWVDGNFDAGSGVLPKVGKPNLQFGVVLDPVVNILRVLKTLTGGDFDSGMNVAMSNSPDNWEYKFDCSQEIPVISFPSAAQLSVMPNPPMKIEAGLKVGFYFNELLAIPTDLKQLVPACGAYVDFQGKLQVQCFTLAVASVYAVGQVDLGLAADSRAGITVRMKFGFGAEIVVGLPVVANVSVLYMVEVQVSVNSTELIVAGLMLFRGHAEICAGLVGITILIEAGGSVRWTPARTDLVAQVTFSIDVCVLWVIDIDFTDSWQESRQIA